MPFNRDALVPCLTRHYDLLACAAFLDPGAIQTPSPEGWSDEQLMADVLRTLGRSEKVTDLLRHLSYINSTDYEVYWDETTPINYLKGGEGYHRGLTAEECKAKSVSEVLLMPYPGSYPASFVSLTEGKEATRWVIDTDGVLQ